MLSLSSPSFNARKLNPTYSGRYTEFANNKPEDRPISDLWAISITPQRCIDFGVHMLVASVFNTVQDFVIVLVPVRTVISLHLPLIQRLTVLLLFAGGILVAIAGAVRTHFSWLMVFSPDGDINWHTYNMMLAGSIELLLGIVYPPSHHDLMEPFTNNIIPGVRLGSSNKAILHFVRPSPPSVSPDSPGGQYRTARC